MSLPDAERVVSDYLRTTLGTRVVGQPPDDTTRAWVRVTQLGAVNNQNDPTGHLTECYLQLDCYAGRDGGQPEASSLGRAVRDAIWDIANHDHSLATVTAGRADGPSRIPDDTFEPARERNVVSAHVWLHG